MARSSYQITINSWDKHNASKKKNHRHFLLENRFFSDSKIAQLSAVETRLYLYLLTVASDLNQSSYILHTNLIPSYFRVRTEYIHNVLTKFESLQLVSFTKVAPDTIENNTKEKKRKEIISTSTGVSKSKKENEKNENKKIRDAYFDAYRLRYGIEPVSNAVFNSQVSNLRKKLGTDDAIKVVEFYLTHNDSFYLKNTHSFGLCLSSAETLRTQMLRGKPITSNDVRNFEKTINLQNVTKSIGEGENF